MFSPQAFSTRIKETKNQPTCQAWSHEAPAKPIDFKSASTGTNIERARYKVQRPNWKALEPESNWLCLLVSVRTQLVPNHINHRHFCSQNHLTTGYSATSYVSELDLFSGRSAFRCSSSSDERGLTTDLWLFIIPMRSTHRRLTLGTEGLQSHLTTEQKQLQTVHPKSLSLLQIPSQSWSCLFKLTRFIKVLSTSEVHVNYVNC